MNGLSHHSKGLENEPAGACLSESRHGSVCGGLTVISSVHTGLNQIVNTPLYTLPEFQLHGSESGQNAPSIAIQ